MNLEKVENSGIRMSFDQVALFLGIYPVGILVCMEYGMCYKVILSWFVIANTRNNLSVHQEGAG